MLTKGRDTFFSARASAENVVHIAFPELDIYPIPCIACPDFNSGAVRSCPDKTIATIHSRVYKTSFGKGRSTLPFRNGKIIPVIQSRMIRRYKAEGFRNSCPAKVRGELVERIGKSMLRTLILCRFNAKLLTHPDSHLIVSTFSISIPLCVHNTDEPIYGFPILHKCILEASGCLPKPN